MPVTKTAKRALRVSKRKYQQNQKIRTEMEAAVRIGKNSKKREDILRAVSLVDRAAKKNVIHKNKAARIKSSLNKIAGPKAEGGGKKKKSSK